MAVKLIACDLDGTLLGADHITVSPGNVRALSEAHERGIKLAVATGRTLSVIYGVIEQLPFLDYAIYSNGAAVCDLHSAKTVYAQYMPAETARDIFSFLLSYPVYFEFYQNGSQHTQKGREKYFKGMDLPAEFLEAYAASTASEDDLMPFAQKGVEKINLFCFDYNEPYYKEIRDYLFSHPGVDCTSPVAGDIEMTAKGVDKSGALGGLCASLGIESGEVMAFGDADNDIGMLQYAGYGAAMENAAGIVKRSARYVTLSNERDGVAAFVEKYALGKKPRLIVSACLLGENCKYNGSNNKNPAVLALQKDFDIVAVCPETFGGLRSPREPSEIRGGRVYSKSGADVTAQFVSGAEKTLYIAEECGARLAVLKERSPSCGCGEIYDGSFTGALTEGNGVAAEMLLKCGIRIFGESSVAELLDETEI